MSKFKVGDEVRIIKDTAGYVGKLRIGDIAIISEFNNTNRSAIMNTETGLCSCFHDLENIELVKPKWTIYNNTLPWKELSDKQKGKMLLAAHDGKSFGTHKAVFKNPDHSYQAVKSKPTMEELFLADWKECCPFSVETFADKIIAKGWAKTMLNSPIDNSIKEAERDKLISQHWDELQSQGQTIFNSDIEKRVINRDDVMFDVMGDMGDKKLYHDMVVTPVPFSIRVQAAFKLRIDKLMADAVNDYYEI
jgi:hypothetical protein